MQNILHGFLDLKFLASILFLKETFFLIGQENKIVYLKYIIKIIYGFLNKSYFIKLIQ